MKDNLIFCCHGVHKSLYVIYNILLLLAFTRIVALQLDGNGSLILFLLCRSPNNHIGNCLLLFAVLPGIRPWNNSFSPMPSWVLPYLRPWGFSVWWWRSLSCLPCNLDLCTPVLCHDRPSRDLNLQHSSQGRGHAIPTNCRKYLFLPFLSSMRFLCNFSLEFGTVCLNKWVG